MTMVHLWIRELRSCHKDRLQRRLSLCKLELTSALSVFFQDVMVACFAVNEVDLARNQVEEREARMRMVRVLVAVERGCKL